MSTLYFSSDHEWVRMDGKMAVVGISNYAQETLGDIVFVDLPQLGQSVSKGEEAVVVESVKAASEIYSPVSGKVVEVNTHLEKEPSLINIDPMDRGWFFKIELADPSEAESLMDEAAYKNFVAGLD